VKTYTIADTTSASWRWRQRTRAIAATIIALGCCAATYQITATLVAAQWRASFERACDVLEDPRSSAHERRRAHFTIGVNIKRAAPLVRRDAEAGDKHANNVLLAAREDWR
jgi:hypothetical protein